VWSVRSACCWALLVFASFGWCGAAASASGFPKGASADQTHPAVVPHLGSARTRFTARLTLAAAPGHVGLFATDYRLQVTVPPHASVARCSPAMLPPNIQSGVRGQVVRVRLGTPKRGWCAGRYRLTVLLERGPYCPAPAAGRPPQPCPEFASQDLDVGETSFVVAPRP